MADAFNDRTARFSGLRQGLVLGAILVILIWTAWIYFVGRAPTSWLPIALPILTASFLLDALISHRLHKRRKAIILLGCGLLLAAVTIYGSVYAPASV